MKKLTLVGAVVILGAIVLSIVMAQGMGEKSPAYARGKVVLSDDLKTAAKNLRTLYIIVSPADSPMPFGALRRTLSDTPEGELYEFALTMDRVQRMREDLPWPEQFKLKARLDADGAAGPDQRGDLVGEITMVQKGAEDLVITIDRLVE